MQKLVGHPKLLNSSVYKYTYCWYTCTVGGCTFCHPILRYFFATEENTVMQFCPQSLIGLVPVRRLRVWEAARTCTGRQGSCVPRCMWVRVWGCVRARRHVHVQAAGRESSGPPDRFSRDYSPPLLKYPQLELRHYEVSFSSKSLKSKKPRERNKTHKTQSKLKDLGSRFLLV